MAVRYGALLPPRRATSFRISERKHLAEVSRSM